MNNFGEYITPEEAYKRQIDKIKKPLRYFQKLAKRPTKKCECCETENEWKFINTGLCFSCATGEADASDDYELITEQANQPEQQPTSAFGTDQSFNRNCSADASQSG